MPGYFSVLSLLITFVLAAVAVSIIVSVVRTCYSDAFQVESGGRLCFDMSSYD